MTLNRASEKCYFVKAEYWSRVSPVIPIGSVLSVSHTGSHSDSRTGLGMKTQTAACLGMYSLLQICNSWSGAECM